MRCTITTVNGTSTLTDLSQKQVNALITIYNDILDSPHTVDRVIFAVEDEQKNRFHVERITQDAEPCQTTYPIAYFDTFNDAKIFCETECGGDCVAIYDSFLGCYIEN